MTIPSSGVPRLPVALVALSLLLLASCFLPPALMSVELERSSPSVGPSESLPFPRPDGTVMGGIYYPAGEGAPLILHLQGSGMSVTLVRGGPDPGLQRLADLGFSSLVIDYSGIGASEGSRSVRNLRGDARMMWEEALDRVDGDPSRIIVRGTSIGTTAAALLMQEPDVRPGGWVLLMPVRPQTAAGHLAGEYAGWLVEGLSHLVFRSFAKVRLEDEVRKRTEPILMVTSEEDYFLSDRERRLLREAVEEAGGTFALESGDHEALSFGGALLLEPEVDWFLERARGAGRDEVETVLARLLPEERQRFAEETEARRRLEALAGGRMKSLHLAAAALAAPDVHHAAWMVWSLDLTPYPILAREDGPLSLSELVETLSFGEGAFGPSPRAVRSVLRTYHYERVIGLSMTYEAPLGVRVRELRERDLQLEQFTYTILGREIDLTASAAPLVEELQRQGADQGVVDRCLARLIAFKDRIPVRTVLRDGHTVLEEWGPGNGPNDDGRWHVVDFASTEAQGHPIVSGPMNLIQQL